MKRYFTFGYDHRHPVTGIRLASRYVVIEGETRDACRTEMLNRFGRNWAFEYSEDSHVAEKLREDPGFEELQREDWPESTGSYEIGPAGYCVERVTE